MESMKVVKNTTTKNGTAVSTYSFSSVSALEFDTICKGLDLVAAEKNPDGLRAYNMLQHIKGLIEERG